MPSLKRLSPLRRPNRLAGIFQDKPILVKIPAGLYESQQSKLTDLLNLNAGKHEVARKQGTAYLTAAGNPTATTSLNQYTTNVRRIRKELRPRL